MKVKEFYAKKLNIDGEEKLYLCSSVYNEGDVILHNVRGEKDFTKLTLVKRYYLPNTERYYWTVKENGYWYYEELIGLSSFKIIGLISSGANWIKSYDVLVSDNCFFDKSEINIIGKMGVNKDGSYNLCYIKCPTCKYFH